MLTKVCVEDDSEVGTSNAERRYNPPYLGRKFEQIWSPEDNVVDG